MVHFRSFPNPFYHHRRPQFHSSFSHMRWKQWIQNVRQCVKENSQFIIWIDVHSIVNRMRYAVRRMHKPRENELSSCPRDKIIYQIISTSLITWLHNGEIYCRCGEKMIRDKFAFFHFVYRYEPLMGILHWIELEDSVPSITSITALCLLSRNFRLPNSPTIH